MAQSKKLLNLLFEERVYPEMKHAEQLLQLINEEMKNRLKDGDQKRVEFPEVGVVCKFVVRQQYRVEQLALNEHLHDLGLLPYVNKIDLSIPKRDPSLWDSLQPFVIADTHSVRIFMNARGKETCRIEYLPSFQHDDLEELAHIWREVHSKYKKVKERKEEIVSQMRSCQTLLDQQSVESEYGRVRLVRNHPKFSLPMIRSEWGDEFLIQHTLTNMSALQEFMWYGLINQKEWNSFRTVVDEPSLHFVIMELEAERNVLSQQYQRMMSTLADDSLNIQ